MTRVILAARGRITTHFHEDIGRGFLHRGIDQGHGDGEAIDLEILAPADGVVTFAGPFGSYGLVIFITHDDGWVSVLAHHKEQLVAKGDRVARRQLIAVMGNTGTVYVHSHQELRDADGNQVDPLLHLFVESEFASIETITLEEDDMFTEQDRAVQDAIYAWIKGDNLDGAGTNLDAIKKSTAKTEAAVADLTAGKGEVHRKLDIIVWALTDATTGLRKVVSGLLAKLTPEPCPAVTHPIRRARAGGRATGAFVRNLNDRTPPACDPTRAGG